ncbi:MAG: hypothetical protein ABIX36_04360 [Mucilaginibacter sp.]|uniref:hypothetical protein n=1 Tax=Mucilaginibacter sp. TaxID=1882438 RepID=UPI0032646C56
MTLFYLLLSTGAYACLLHCATDYLATRLENRQEAQVTDKDQAHNEKEGDEDCRNGECNCCYHHGTYVVKENAKIGSHFSFHPTDLGILLLQTESCLYIPLKIANKVSWPRPNGPPFLRSQPIYLSNQSLLI